MSKITGVHHIAIHAVDFDRSISFYTEVLGLSVKNTWVRTTGRAALIEIVHGSYMEIFEWPPAPAGVDLVLNHFSLRTDDVDGMTERARAAGYPVTVAPLAAEPATSIGTMKLRLSFIKGPDGEDIELMSSDIV